MCTVTLMASGARRPTQQAERQARARQLPAASASAETKRVPHNSGDLARRPAGRVVVRVGVFMLIRGRPATAPTLAAEVRSALEDDPRVRSASGTGGSEDWSYSPTFWIPDRVHRSVADHVQLFEGSDFVTGVQFADPLTFVVEVPRKNQPAFGEPESAAAERY